VSPKGCEAERRSRSFQQFDFEKMSHSKYLALWKNNVPQRFLASGVVSESGPVTGTL
jgi:hypothetical protein